VRELGLFVVFVTGVALLSVVGTPAPVDDDACFFASLFFVSASLRALLRD
jgi:hypothetical protein